MKDLDKINQIVMTPEATQVTSSLNSKQNIIIAILNLEKPEQIKDKLNSFKTSVSTNSVEKQIIKDVETTLDLNNEINPNYIEEKFSYYFNLSPKQEIKRDQIDFAIMDVQANQAREEMSAKLMTLASDVEHLSTPELKERLQTITEGSRLTSRAMGTTIENGFRKQTSAYKNLTQNRGEFTLAIPELEKAAGRPSRGHVVSVLAFTGSFKSTYSLNLAYENALLGHNVLYLSLESTEDLMASRITINHIAKNAKKRADLISQEKLRDATLLESEQKHYDNSHNDLVDKLGGRLFLIDTKKFSSNTFTEMTETLRIVDHSFKQTTGKGLDMVVLDQLSLLKYSDVGGRTATYDGAIMNAWIKYFQGQALNFLGEDEREILFLNVAQVRREAYQEASKQKNKGRYDATAAGDANEIERISDTIITIYKDLDIMNTALFHVPKARHGSGTDEPIQVEVYGEYFRIGGLDGLDGEQITAESFIKEDFNLDNLLNM